MVVLCEEGDIIFVCGNDSNAKFQVSSMAIKNASPVFKAMLSSRFAGGQAMSTTSRPEIKLGGDDPEGLEVMLRHIHFLKPTVIMSCSVIYGFAVVCDKYGCTESLAEVMNSYLWDYKLVDVPTDALKGYLLKAAHLFKLEEQVKRLAIEIAKELEESIAGFAGATQGFLDLDHICLIDNVRTQMYDHLHGAVDKILHNASCEFVVDLDQFRVILQSFTKERVTTVRTELFEIVYELDIGWVRICECGQQPCPDLSIRRREMLDILDLDSQQWDMRSIEVS